MAGWMCFRSRLSQMEIRIQIASTTIHDRREMRAMLTATLTGRNVDKSRLSIDSRTPKPAGVIKTTKPTDQARAKIAAAPIHESVEDCGLIARLRNWKGKPIASHKIKPTPPAAGIHLKLTSACLPSLN